MAPSIDAAIRIGVEESISFGAKEERRIRP